MSISFALTLRHLTTEVFILSSSYQIKPEPREGKLNSSERGVRFELADGHYNEWENGVKSKENRILFELAGNLSQPFFISHTYVY